MYKRYAGQNALSVKSHNFSIILFNLLLHGTLSRSKLTHITGLSATTITNIINELMAGGIVEESSDTILSASESGLGRPRTALQLSPDSRFVVGIHLGVGRAEIAITNLKAEIRAETTIRFDRDEAPSTVLNAIAAQVPVLMQDFDRDRFLGVGVGALGLVDPETGINIVAPNLHWHDLPIGEMLASQLNMPVSVNNNVRLMALGQAMFGIGKEANSLAYIQVREGIGAGLIINRQLYHGNLNTAGELGHTRLIVENGKQCSCGNIGCLETVAAVPYIVDEARAFLSPAPADLSFQDVLEAATHNQDVQSLLEQSARYLGIALANLINLISPELIILGGIYANSPDSMLTFVEEEIRRGVFADLGDHIQLRTIASSSKAGLVGAAALALDKNFYHLNP
ncbi:MAG: ROK family protein [Anaerolineae bacterium]|nr:ROK family protein [Anaerolineae bacterium]MCA9888957.1 ROK family protein [Anaerolineae bacterium]MCA9893071.1 ROK family protein [Anaerolineae bacterium]